jgi:NAD(P)-dependent dehydrogenase (short-subunit alcohol dehydrogenase family)
VASDRPDVICVLVTGAGGAAGVAVIRELGRIGHRAVAADADPLGARRRRDDRSPGHERRRSGEWAAEPDDPSTWASASTVAEAIDLVLAEIGAPADESQVESTPTSPRKSTSPGTSR